MDPQAHLHPAALQTVWCFQDSEMRQKIQNGIENYFIHHGMSQAHVTTLNEITMSIWNSVNRLQEIRPTKYSNPQEHSLCEHTWV